MKMKTLAAITALNLGTPAAHAVMIQVNSSSGLTVGGGTAPKETTRLPREPLAFKTP